MATIEKSQQIGKKILTLDLSDVPSMEELRNEHVQKYHIYQNAELMIKKLRVAPVRVDRKLIRKADIIAVTMSELGLPLGGTFHEAYEAGLSHRLRLCPGFFALLIRDGYNHPTKENMSDWIGQEMFFVAMPSVKPGPFPSVFLLERDLSHKEGKCLSSHETAYRYDPTKLSGGDVLLFWREPQE